MEPIIVTSGVTVLSASLMIILLIRKSKNKYKKKKYLQFSEINTPQKKKELFASFQHRDCFKIEHNDDSMNN